jgi:HAD superfamily hydrolase (TIGR01490 family)
MYEKGPPDKNLALFDFDGTLCLKDSFTGFVFCAHSKRHILKQGVKLLPWIQAYYLKLYPAHAMRPKLYQAMFSDQDANEIQNLAEAYAKTLPQHFDVAIYRQLQQHVALGHDVVLVSASLDLYLIPLCQRLKIALICTQTEQTQGRLTGEYASPDCSRMQKQQRILAELDLSQYQQIYAYGNSEEDQDMLALADYPYMVGVDKVLPELESLHNLGKLA